MSVEFYRGSPRKFDSRTLNRKTLDRWTGRITTSYWPGLVWERAKGQTQMLEAEPKLPATYYYYSYYYHYWYSYYQMLSILLLLLLSRPVQKCTSKGT